LSRHGRHDGHQDATRQGPFGGEQSREGPGRHAGEADEPTTVMRFGSGVFDGPPPDRRHPEESRAIRDRHASQEATQQWHAPREFADDPGDDVYDGGYSYAARDRGTERYHDPDAYDTDTFPAYVPDSDDTGDPPPRDVEERAADVATATSAGGSAVASRGRTGRTKAAPKSVPAATNTTPSAGAKRKRRGRIVGVLAAVVMLAVFAGGGYFAYQRYFYELPDFDGPAGPVAIVEVHSGDTAAQIAGELTAKGVVASADGFYNAAVQNPGMNAMHPGFYAVPTNLPAVDAVAELVDPDNRVGALVVSEGRQLHDISDVNTGAVRKGIFTLISEASCYDDAGTTHCITYDELAQAAAGPDLDALGVPDWARDAVSTVPDPGRQLEGLIAAGSWNFDPSASATEVLNTLVTGSSARYTDTGITAAAQKVGLTPYELLVAASLVEREALPPDFTRVARVILNRLAIGQMLQFDSTVNYALDETELATTDEDRARVTPWNTYASPGLPATPISSPSIGALESVENPEPGSWLYFVTIDDRGTTLFADTYEEHLVNTELALANGILNSGR